jgi:hypothetical protein
MSHMGIYPLGTCENSSPKKTFSLLEFTCVFLEGVHLLIHSPLTGVNGIFHNFGVS